MIEIQTYRQYAEYCDQQIFTYLDKIANSQLINLKGVDKKTDEYLLTIMMISLLNDIKIIFKKKLINSTAKILKIKMTQSQGIAFYKTLLRLPIPAGDFYFNMVRNLLIEILDQQIVK